MDFKALLISVATATLGIVGGMFIADKLKKK
jgi:uncharacterized protein YneF (UPF0154 family)